MERINRLMALLLLFFFHRPNESIGEDFFRNNFPHLFIRIKLQLKEIMSSIYIFLIN